MRAGGHVSALVEMAEVQDMVSLLVNKCADDASHVELQEQYRSLQAHLTSLRTTHEEEVRTSSLLPQGCHALSMCACVRAFQDVTRYTSGAGHLPPAFAQWGGAAP